MIALLAPQFGPSNPLPPLALGFWRQSPNGMGEKRRVTIAPQSCRAGRVANRVLSRRDLLSASRAGLALPFALRADSGLQAQAPAGGGDQTVQIQAAIDRVGPLGGTITIPEGVAFNLQALRLPPRVNLSYRLDDDLSTDLPGPDPASGERVYFSANSSFPAQRSGGAVNEWRFTAPFHPGLVVDVRKDVRGADAGLGANQNRTEPARASYLLQDSQVSRWRVLYENYGARQEPLAGIRIHSWRAAYLLQGVGASAWPTAPALRDRIVGDASGAVGFVREVRPAALVVEWFSGAFRVGESLRNTTKSETSTSPIAAAAFTESENAGIGMDLWHGTVTVGDGNPGVATETLQTYGNLKLVPTRGTSVNNVKHVRAPTLILGGNPEMPVPHQLGIQYDPSQKNDATRRLVAVGDDLAEWRGEWCSVSAMCSFDAGLGVETNATNIGTIARTAPGAYLITFLHPLRRPTWIAPDPSVGGETSDGWSARFIERRADGCRIQLYDRAGARADLPAGAWLSFLILGGDV